MNSCFKYGMLSLVNVKLSVTTITLSGTVVPVLCALGDYMLFGEVVLVRHFVGCSLILLGLAINANMISSAQFYPCLKHNAMNL